MKFGMTEQQFQILDKLVIQPLKQQGAEVFIFGSRLAKYHHHHSDVDILYRLPGPIGCGVISEIKEAIEESRFPFMVDLVAEADLVESYRDNILHSMQKL
jgi:predicted nucleotidyltransferase